MAREQDDDGAEVLEGRDLRAAAKQLAKGPMKFAFGFKEARNPVLLLHKTKSARVLSNELKSLHGATKATHGLASAEEQTLVLEVQGADIPGMDRMVKTILRKEKVGKLTETRVERKPETVEGEPDRPEAGAATAAGTDPLLERLRALRDEIQRREGAVGSALQRLGAGGDAAPVSDYVRLCVEFGREARGSGDAELVQFAKTALERAKKMSGMLERFAGAAGAPGAPGAMGAAAAPGGKPGAAPGGAPGAVPEGVSVEGGYGDNSGGIKKTADGIEINFKHEKSLPLFARNFKVWVIPCYTKGGLKASIAGTGIIGKTDGVKVSSTGAGSLELGVGATTEVVTAGPYGSIELSASYSATVQYSEGASGTPDGWTVEPFTFSVNGTGKVGIKVEVEGGGKLDVGQDVANWELFVVYVGRYSGGKFESIDVRAGKDLNRLIAALEQAGPAIEQAVEKYAPESVKQAAVKGAEWAAESDEAGKVADVVDEAFQDLEDETGVDAGGAVEEIVQSLVDEHGETAAEATRRVNEEMEKFGDTQEDLHAALGASGLNGELKPFRSSAEYNAIIDVWQAEGEVLVKGGSVPGKWKTMIADLAGLARQRQAQGKAQAKAQAAAKKQAEDATAAALAAAAVAAMEAARPGAQGQGNVLNNRLAQTPNATAKQFFNKGWQDWAAAEAARAQVAGLSGEAKAQKAREATAAYERARATFTTGIQHL